MKTARDMNGCDTLFEPPINSSFQTKQNNRYNEQQLPLWPFITIRKQAANNNDIIPNVNVCDLRQSHFTEHSLLELKAQSAHYTISRDSGWQEASLASAPPIEHFGWAAYRIFLWPRPRSAVLGTPWLFLYACAAVGCVLLLLCFVFCALCCWRVGDVNGMWAIDDQITGPFRITKHIEHRTRGQRTDTTRESEDTRQQTDDDTDRLFRTREGPTLSRENRQGGAADEPSCCLWCFGRR